MADLDVVVTVTTPDITGPSLVSGASVDPPGSVQVVSYDPGGRVKRRQSAQSPTVAGSRRVSTVPDQRVLSLVLRFMASSKTNLDALTQTWFNALDQVGYQVTVSIEGVDVTWDCDDADWALANDNGEGVDKYRLTAAPMRQAWRFSIPCQPDPTTGVF